MAKLTKNILPSRTYPSWFSPLSQWLWDNVKLPEDNYGEFRELFQDLELKYFDGDTAVSPQKQLAYLRELFEELLEFFKQFE